MDNTDDSNKLASASELATLDYSNFVLLTRKKSQAHHAFKTYNLVDQTKTVSFYRSKMRSLYFDKETIDDPLMEMENNATSSNSSSVVPRLIQSNTNVSGECFLVTRIDILTNQRLSDFYDCKCNASNLMQQTNCSYNTFWTDEMSEQTTEHRSSSSDVVVKQGCADASEYACFNNGTCVDNNIDQEEGHSCNCVGSYTGSRLVNAYFFTFFNYEE